MGWLLSCSYPYRFQGNRPRHPSSSLLECGLQLPEPRYSSWVVVNPRVGWEIVADKFRYKQAGYCVYDELGRCPDARPKWCSRAARSS